ncbi:MAG: beta-ketoacyl synthase N-terminal-like domain-containing protein [Bacteroidota bacterium]
MKDLEDIWIAGLGMVSPAGLGTDGLLDAYRSGAHKLVYDEELEAWIGRLEKSAGRIDAFIRLPYARLDPTTHYAIFAARRATEQANWQTDPKDYGILIGSSRGATTIWEAEHRQFLEAGQASPFASPTTTLGNISSWVGQDLGQRGFRSSHSVTCSTAAHALVQAVAWLRVGMAERMLIGGAEAPLTTFTLAQMRAMRIYSRASSLAEWPCTPLGSGRATGMVLAEGAGALALERGRPKNALAQIAGLGYAQEKLESPTGIDPAGSGIAQAMRMALQSAGLDRVDLVITHAPGTAKGDAAEWAALKAVFGDTMPLIANTKWMQGHGLGASAAWSLGLAIAAMNSDEGLPGLPYSSAIDQPQRKIVPESALVNAMGFGGNCVSILLIL